MRIYASQGFHDFIIAAGHLREVIREWADEHKRQLWKRYRIAMAVEDTGEETQTGGRLARLAAKGYLNDTFMMTYGDGMADININALLDFHFKKARYNHWSTLSAVNPPSRFGTLEIDKGTVTSFGEKSQLSNGWINGGFYVIEPETLSLINGDLCRWEYEVLPVLALQGQLAAYQHPGYFQMCDTWRDLQRLEEQTYRGAPPWLRFEKGQGNDKDA